MSSKVCARKPTQKYPDVYTREEIETFAINKGFTKEQMKGLNNFEVCLLANISWKGPRSTLSKKYYELSMMKIQRKREEKMINEMLSLSLSPKKNKNKDDLATALSKLSVRR